MQQLRFRSALIALTAVTTIGLGQAVAGNIGGDDFDGGGIYLSRSIVPDLSGNTPPGSFPGSRFDVFGIVNRDVNFDFADDSAGSFPDDTFGILRTGKVDNVFGVEDLTNNDNPGGTGTATWTFDISGYTDIAVAIDFAAMGDFESSNDSYVFTASIDGGADQTLFSSVIREDIDPYTYFLESGTPVDLNDPAEIDGVIIDNNFHTLSAMVNGTGSTLTLTFSASSDGGSEVFLFDNLNVSGVPEPTSLLLLAVGALGLLRRR